MGEDETYRVGVWLDNASQAIWYDALCVYVKGPYTCIQFFRNGKEWVHKYPTDKLVRVEEEYRHIVRMSSRAD